VSPTTEHAPTRAVLGRCGRWFTDATGRVVTLHGVNMVHKHPPYEPLAIGFGEQDARLIAGWGFNTVRIGWIWKALEPEPGSYDDAYLGRIAKLARLLAGHGQHVLVDFHQDMYNERFSGEGFPDWAVQDGGLPHRPDLGFPRNYFFMPGLWRAYDSFWANRPGPGGVGLQDSFAAAWRHVAERLAPEPSVFYDIFNEPFPGSSSPACVNPRGYARFDRKLTAMSVRVLAAIREVEPERLVLYEPSVLFNNGSRTHHAPLHDERTGLSFHNYCLVTTPGMPQLRGPAQDRVCLRAEQRVFSNALDHAYRAKCALLLSEFGATDDLRTIGRVCELADRNMVSWQYWAYFNADPSSLRPQECIVRDLSQPREDSNLNRAKAEVLSRPFPRAVAGTPRGWSFDPRVPEFRLRYATSDLHGNHFPEQATTEVFLPEHLFGEDPSIDVAGAQVVVMPGDTQLLELVADPEAAEVTLRVSA
jgi:endoglycosylceramidase